MTDLMLTGLATVGMGLSALWLSSRKGGDRLSQVQDAFAQSEGVLYSYGGGHYPPIRWPYGGPGVNGSVVVPTAVGWDCSGWVVAVMRQSGVNVPLLGSGALWAKYGSPKNGLTGAKPGNLIWWGSGGSVVHVGFVIDAENAVSAFGRGPGVLANDPNAKVKLHKISGAGNPVIGTASW